jgi:phosphatidylglycerol:prolipoprotein diacylglycerol transferase
VKRRLRGILVVPKGLRVHPILVELAPLHCAILGAAIAVMFLWSHWAANQWKTGTLGKLAVGVLIAVGVGAVVGYMVGNYLDPDGHHPPKIHTFGPLVALGSFAAILYIRSEGKRRGFDPEVLTGLAVEVLLVGVAGARVLFILITPEVFPHKPTNTFFYNYVIQYVALWNGGLVWYGGLLPAAPFALWRGAKLGLPWRTVADIFAPAVMLGLGIGRIGCLMAGDDHGKVVESGAHWWTVTFTDPEALVSPESLKGKPLWPSQPMMSIGCLTIFALCHAVRKKLQSRPACVMFLMMTLYPIQRFFIEMIRGDIVRKFLWGWETRIDPFTGQPVYTAGISTSQAISIPLAVVMAGFLVRALLKAPTGAEQPGPQAALKAPEPAAPPVALAPEAPPP